jgi:glycosyltransferase involved in cell wall biosynthesis
VRILFLTSQVPHPMRSGATIKTATVLRYLQQRHEVHVACLRNEELDVDQAAWADGFAGFESVRLSRGRNALNLLRSYASGLPLSIERNRSKEMARLVERAIAGASFDAVFVDGWLMAQYLPPEFAGITVLHEHNAEYVMWERQVAVERNPLMRRLVSAEAARVREYEASILPQFDTVFAVSVTDQLALEEIGPKDLKVRVLPNAADPSLLELEPLSFGDSGKVVLYLGTLSWQPNLEGLSRFLREVWPLVRRQAGDARLLIAGEGAPRSLRQLAGREKGVEFAEAVETNDDIYRRARVFVEATRSGGGTKVKLLNTLARGLPTVASPEAFEGIGVTAGQDALVEKTSSAMAAGIVRLFDDSELWQRLSDNGRKLIRERYRPDVAYAVLDQVLSDAAATV